MRNHVCQNHYKGFEIIRGKFISDTCTGHFSNSQQQLELYGKGGMGSSKLFYNL